MAFAPEQHLRSLKGQQYLDVKWRLVWLREEHPEAVIKTELVQLDLDQKLAIFRAEVSIPGKGSATGYGSETERDFPQGWIEKSETKAVGRALAALGFGTQFALELDEGDRVVDSPVSTPTRRGERTPNERAPLKMVADAHAADTHLDELRGEVAAALQTDRDAAVRLPKPADEMSVAELEKTLVWLRNRAKRQA